MTVEAQSQRYLCAGSRKVFLGRNPAGAQCGKHVPDRIQGLVIGGIPLARLIGRITIGPTCNCQLQSLAHRIVDIR